MADTLPIYLNDHLAGAEAGTSLARRAAVNHRDTPFGADLADIARDIDADRASLLAIMSRLGVRRDPLKRLAAIVGERASRFKPNGSVLARSPLSSVIELELLRLGVLGKASGWRSLREVADGRTGLDARELDELIRRAEAQADRLEQLRLRAARLAFG